MSYYYGLHICERLRCSQGAVTDLDATFLNIAFEAKNSLNRINMY